MLDSEKTNADVKVKPPLAGVAGWLALLVFGLMVGGPLMLLGRVSQDIGDAERAETSLIGNVKWDNFKMYTWCLCVALMALSIYTGYMLWKKRGPHVVKAAVINVWVLGPIGGAALATVPQLLAFGQVYGLNEMIPGMIGTLGPAVLWTLYLYRSKRVKNTYL